MRSLAIQFDSKPVLNRLAMAVFATLAVACVPSAHASQATTSTTLAITSGTPSAPTNSVTLGTAISLTATVASGASPVRVGLVKFCDASATYCTDQHIVATAQLTSAGTATAKAVPGLGTHSYLAVFVGTSSYGTSSSSTENLTVTGAYATGTTIAYTNYALNATVLASGNSKLYPTGSVSFLDTSAGGVSIGNAPLQATTLNEQFVIKSTPSIPCSFNNGGCLNGGATADFNHDGIVDVAIADQDNDTVQILLERVS